MDTTTQSEAILSSEAARILGISSQAVHYLERTGRLAATRASGVRIFQRVDVVRLAAERREAAQQRGWA